MYVHLKSNCIRINELVPISCCACYLSDLLLQLLSLLGLFWDILYIVKLLALALTNLLLD